MFFWMLNVLFSLNHRSEQLFGIKYLGIKKVTYFIKFLNFIWPFGNCLVSQTRLKPSP